MLHLEPQRLPRFVGTFPHTHMLPASLVVIKTWVLVRQLGVLLLLYLFVRTELHSILGEFASLISAVSV